MKLFQTLFRYTRILSPILAISLLSLLAAAFEGYTPFQAMISQHMFFRVIRIRSASETDFNASVAILQNAIKLNPDNCAAYELLGNLYSIQAFNTNPDVPDQELLKKDVQVGEEGLKHCPTGLVALFTEYALARDYSIFGDHEKSIYHLKKLVEANPIINADPSRLEMGDIYFHLGQEYEGLGNTSEALQAYLNSAQFQSDVGQQGDAVKAINSFLDTNPSLAGELVPERLISIGKYSSVAKTLDGTVVLIGTAQLNPAILLYATQKPKSNWQAQSVLMVNNEKVGALTLDIKGIVHIIYGNGSSSLVYTNTKDGLNKSLLVDLSNPQTPLASLFGRSVGISQPQIAIGPNETAHIVYAYGNFQLGYFTIQNGESSQPTILANNTVFPDIAVSSDNSTYVVYNNNKAFPSVLTQVWFMEKKGESWSKPIQLSENGTWSGAATLNVQSDGTINVVYIAGISAQTTKLMYTHRDLNGNWSSPMVIAEENYRPWIPTSAELSYGGRTGPSIELTNDNILAVVWHVPGEPTKVMGIARKDGSWGTIQLLGEIVGEIYQDSPSVMAVGSKEGSKIFILWPEGGIPVIHEWKP